MQFFVMHPVFFYWQSESNLPALIDDTGHPLESREKLWLFSFSKEIGAFSCEVSNCISCGIDDGVST